MWKWAIRFTCLGPDGVEPPDDLRERPVDAPPHDRGQVPVVLREQARGLLGAHAERAAHGGQHELDGRARRGARAGRVAVDAVGFLSRGKKKRDPHIVCC